MAVHVQAHAGSPRELMARIEAERRGTPFLIYRDGDGNQRVVDLAGAPSRVCIGRNPDSDLPLPWDGEASRLHAELERIAGEWTLVDDGRSRNGTFLNERRVRGRARLVDGDVVRVGRTALTFRAPAAAGSTTMSASGEPIVLSPAQRRVLISLCRPILRSTSFAAPASNRQIAAELFVSTETVRTHIRALFEALGIGSTRQNEKRAELARVAIERGVVTPRDFEEHHTAAM